MTKQRIFKYAVALAKPSKFETKWRYFRTLAEAVAFAESVTDIADTIWVHDGQAWTIDRTQPSYTYGR